LTTPIIPAEYTSFVWAGITILIGILDEPHYVTTKSVLWNAIFFVATWLTSPIPNEFFVLLIVYLLVAYLVLRRSKTEDLSGRRQGRTISFIFLGSRGYGSMLMSMALFQQGLLGWLDYLPFMPYLAFLVSFRYALVGWLLILVLVHIVGRVVRRPRQPL
jgi:hypothetical protein